MSAAVRDAGRAMYRLTRAAEAQQAAGGIGDASGIGRAMLDAEQARAAAGISVEEAVEAMRTLFPNAPTPPGT